MKGIEIKDRILVAIALETGKRAENMGGIIFYTKGGDSFIHALHELYLDQEITNVEFVFGGDDSRPIEAVWTHARLTEKGMRHVKQLLDQAKKRNS
ncbi:hypothetical protein [Brevibacillus sp. H7]|uniref:hypothetical protein n=1 Tax=Brevibacillus sp. H7 TaxID=3349138 RepID=UPI00380A5B95